MRHGDKSFPAIYVMVVLAHVGAIAWVLLGARGCQQSLVASTAAKDSAAEKSALRLNLALPQSVAESLSPATENPQSDEEGRRQTHAVSEGEDPASRLTLPSSAERDAKVEPEPAPPAVREVPREKPDLAEREKQAQEEAETQARQRDAIRQAEETRKEEELAAKEEERKSALKQEADRNAAAQAERQAEQERKKEESARKENERKRARELDAERKAAEAERQRKLVEQRERERQQREAASKRKEEERKLALRQEAERKAAAEAERRRQLAEQQEEERRAAEAAERQLAEQREEERRAAEAAERQRQLAQQREEERRAAEAADERQRQLAEQREREEAKRIEKARVVGGTAPVSPAVVKPNLVAAAEGGNGSSPEVVPAKPRGGGSPDAGVLDMDAYRATVQKMIQNRWTIPRGIVVENYPEVVLRINRAGKVVFARNERNSGVPELDRSAINAVRIGSQLIPLPAGYDKDVYEVKVKFQVD